MMTNEEFGALTKDTQLEGSKLCFKNAKVHFECANKVADAGHFGIANSLLILAAEESIKGMILAAVYFNVSLPFEIDLFFRLHKVKHQQAEEMQPFLGDMQLLSEALAGILEQRASSQWGLKVDVGLVLTFFSVINRFFGKERSEVNNFWKKANGAKNRGFYIDIQNGRWIDPVIITESDFHESLKEIQPYLTIAKFVEQLQPDDYKEFDFRNSGQELQ
jgi:AbiV family abortive infection protein